MSDNDETLRRHLRFGWLSLLIWLSMGLVLEALHGFKVGFYLEVANSARRHLWTLAHSHGALLAVVNLVYAWTSSRLQLPRASSGMLMAASLLMPLGFLLGGLSVHDGDPGVGVFLVPVGGVLLLGAVGLTAKAVWTSR